MEEKRKKVDPFRQGLSLLIIGTVIVLIGIFMQLGGEAEGMVGGSIGFIPMGIGAYILLVYFYESRKESRNARSNATSEREVRVKSGQLVGAVILGVIVVALFVLFRVWIYDLPKCAEFARNIIPPGYGFRVKQEITLFGGSCEIEMPQLSFPIKRNRDSHSNAAKMKLRVSEGSALMVV